MTPPRATTRTALLNQKGGVGKTTTTLHLGGALAAAGRRVLLVDMDPQANLTRALGVGLLDHQDGRTLPKAMLGHKDDPDYALSLVREHSPGLHVIPASYDLLSLCRQLYTARSAEDRLDWVLEHLDSRYDHVLVDCRPALEIDTDCVLRWADDVLVPVELDTTSIDAVKLLTAQVHSISTDARQQPPAYRGLVINLIPQGRPTKYRVRMREAFHSLPVPVVGEIPIRDSLVQAKDKHQTIHQYDPTSDAAAMYTAMATTAGYLTEGTTTT
ncbi:ParA family protein [Streptomyces sp. NPDC048603]|uniref:ParA family protein n=1 Tax=Streptomyces sp. NPDC048603 TaxID=3365577 RepID=UPI0037161D96